MTQAQRLAVEAGTVFSPGFGEIKVIACTEILQNLGISDITLTAWLKNFGLARLELPRVKGSVVLADTFAEAVSKNFFSNEGSLVEPEQEVEPECSQRDRPERLLSILERILDQSLKLDSRVANGLTSTDVEWATRMLALLSSALDVLNSLEDQSGAHVTAIASIRE